MSKIPEVFGSINIFKPGTKRHDFTIRLITFDPKKHFVCTHEAKDIVRIRMHMSKAKMANEYDSIYAVCMKVGRGKNAHYEFTPIAKQAANCIFIIPKKHKRMAYKSLDTLEISGF